MNRAALNGHLNVVKWLHENRTEGCTNWAMDGAAQNGKLTMVKWLHQNRNEGCTTLAMNSAAENGHLNVVVDRYSDVAIYGYTEYLSTGYMKIEMRVVQHMR
jgi:hypothetical protein